MINSGKVTVIIDYPLKAEYQFELASDAGFSRAFLLKEISKAYYKTYEEEEATASIRPFQLTNEQRSTIAMKQMGNTVYGGLWLFVPFKESCF